MIGSTNPKHAAFILGNVQNSIARVAVRRLEAGKAFLTGIVHVDPVNRSRPYITFSILKQLIDSQERGDVVMLSDLLEYEILPMAPIWREMFLAIEKSVNAAN